MNALNRITNSNLHTLPYNLRTQMLAGTLSSNQSQLDSLVNNLLKQTFCELMMTLKSGSVSDFIIKSCTQIWLKILLQLIYNIARFGIMRLIY